jgi:sugar-specific transcriptional regulator TrmB
MMELSKRAVPKVPDDPKELAKEARKRYEPALAELEKVLEGVSDADANKIPEPGEWSAMETLAHLLHNERGYSAYFSEMINGYERTADGFGTNIHAAVKATVKAYPTVKVMLAEIRASVEETLAFLSMLPKEFVARKGSYYRLGAGFMQDQFHISGHASHA